MGGGDSPLLPGSHQATLCLLVVFDVKSPSFGHFLDKKGRKNKKSLTTERKVKMLAKNNIKVFNDCDDNFVKNKFTEIMAF